MKLEPPFTHNHTRSCAHQMSNDGVIFLRKQIKNDYIYSMKSEIDQIRQHVMLKIRNMDRPLKTYTDIAERQLNRLDYHCGFVSNIFQEVAKPIIELIRALSPRYVN